MHSRRREVEPDETLDGQVRTGTPETLTVKRAPSFSSISTRTPRSLGPIGQLEPRTTSNVGSVSKRSSLNGITRPADARKCVSPAAPFRMDLLVRDQTLHDRG